MKKQVDLNGKSTEIASLSRQRREDLSIWKSMLQKAVRRGMTEKACMHVETNLQNVKEAGEKLAS